MQSTARPAALPADAHPMASRDPGAPPRAYFWLMILYFVLEYARPPGIVQLRLQMVVVLVMPVLWLSARERPWHAILTAQLVFLALCAVHIPFAHNNYSAYFVSRVMFGHVSIAIGLSWLFSQRKRFVQGIWAWVLIMTYVAIFGITHKGTGPGGFLGDENDLALALVTAFPFGFFGFEQLRSWRRWLAGGFSLITVVAIVISFSRGGFVGLAGAGVYCWAVSRRKIRNLMVLLVAAAAFVALAPKSYLAELSTIKDTDAGTAESRRFLWETAYNMWLDHKLFGVGGENFTWLAGAYQPTNFQRREYREQSWSGTAVHSALFQLLSEQGLAGLGVCLFIGISHLRTIRRLRRDVRRSTDADPKLRRDADLYGASLSAAMVGYAVAGLFLSCAYYPYLWYFSGLSVALDAAIRRELPQRPVPA